MKAGHHRQRHGRSADQEAGHSQPTDQDDRADTKTQSEHAEGTMTYAERIKKATRGTRPAAERGRADPGEDRPMDCRRAAEHGQHRHPDCRDRAGGRSPAQSGEGAGVVRRAARPRCPRTLPGPATLPILPIRGTRPRSPGETTSAQMRAARETARRSGWAHAIDDYMAAGFRTALTRVRQERGGPHERGVPRVAV